MGSPRPVVWNSDESVFTAAMALPAVERHRYLEKVCSSDHTQLSRVERLLQATTQASNFVKERCAQSQFEAAGDVIDRYRLIEVLGEGGCGVVYSAEQITPVRRELAIKLIKAGMDTKAVLGRFETERHALALMDHPHIAQVFDAGVSPTTGRPYFVLELVRGIRITDYANQSRLNVAERLTLFLQVCHAIQHAHHRGVIHRDIKPSNVLVTMHDGVPLAKVIDFGLAKALSNQLPNRNDSQITAVEQFLGTPIYASPEQSEPRQAAVDTRSDIYSLGVLLYELLTGCTPFDASDFLRTRFGRIQRIRLEEPRKPSERVESVGDGSRPSTETCYGLNAAKLRKQLRGDLDWIALRCLETDPAKRYQSANELSSDIERYLRHENISARPPSILYTTQKFARRHRVLFAAYIGVAGFVLFAIAAAIMLSLQARRLSAERDRAEAEKTQAEQMISIVSRIVTAADPWENYRRERATAPLLDEAAQEMMTLLQGPSEERNTRLEERLVPLFQTLGRTYMRLGDAQKAIPFLEHAIRVQSAANRVDHSALLSVMVDLSIALRLQGDIAGAQKVLMAASELADRQQLMHSLLYAQLLLSRGHNEIFLSSLAEARKDLEQSLTLMQEFTGPTSKDVAEVLLALSRLCQWTDDLAEAERMARKAATMFAATVPPMYPDRVHAEARLAEVLYLRNEVALAEPLFVDSLQKQRLIFGRNNWLVADAMESLARIRRSQGRLVEAETLLRDAVTVHSTALGDEHPMSAFLRTSLAALLLERRNYGEAEWQLRRALRYQSQMTASEQYIASTEYLLGEVLLATNQLSEAERLLQSSIDRWRRAGAPAWRAARSASALGEVLYRQGHVQAAARHLAESYEVLESSNAVEPEVRLRAKQRFEQFSTTGSRSSGVEGVASVIPQ